MSHALIACLLYGLAAFAEIAGCFSVWAWLRLGRSPLWLLPGGLCLGLFAILLTFSPADHAGRAYALYGGLYIVTSLFWGWAVEGLAPDACDMAGAALCLVGALLILLAPHSRT